MSNFAPATWGGSGKKSVQAVRSTRGTNEAEEPTAAEATDAAKALAAENNIDLGTVTGTGADGRITVDDVRATIPPEPEPQPVENETEPAEPEPVTDQLDNA